MRNIRRDKFGTAEIVEYMSMYELSILYGLSPFLKILLDRPLLVA